MGRNTTEIRLAMYGLPSLDTGDISISLRFMQKRLSRSLSVVVPACRRGLVQLRSARIWCAGSIFLLSGCASNPFSVATGDAERSAAAEQARHCSAAESADLQRAYRERMLLLETLMDRQRLEYRALSDEVKTLEATFGIGMSRAEAVTYLAEAEILLRRARDDARIDRLRLDSAQDKLADAKSHLDRGNIGAAVFVAHLARRLARVPLADSRDTDEVLRVRSERANLRAGPTLDSRIVAVLDKDAQVYKTAQLGKWILGYTSNWHVGWISNKVLAPKPKSERRLGAGAPG